MKIKRQSPQRLRRVSEFKSSNPLWAATQFGLLADFSWSVKIVDIPAG
jgi:hypothetical protein